jgi:hypothetical protein
MGGLVPRDAVEEVCSLAYRYSLVYRELGILMGDMWDILGVLPAYRNARPLLFGCGEHI